MPDFPQATDDGDAFYLTPGTNVPPVALPATDGTAVNLAALRGRSVVIVYPWTGRPGFPNPPDWDLIPGAHGSTPELEGFRVLHGDFAQAGLRLFGSSRQDTAYQRELVARLGWPFPILSDEAGARSARGSPSQPSRRVAQFTEAPHALDRRRPHREGILSRHRPAVATPRRSCDV